MLIHPVWRFIDTKISTAHYNMALDEALLKCFSEGDLPILRLYGWENALSFGKFSSIETSIDQKMCEEKNIPIVRRMSGGGVLMHGGDISYSLILPRESLKDRSVKANYDDLCSFLLQLYARLGYSADFACNQTMDIIKSEICLAGTEAYDIVIEGKKMGGNAQRYTRKALFQHGSIPMHIDESLFAPCFFGDCGIERAATLDGMGSTIDRNMLTELVKSSFCESLGVTLREESLRPCEEETARELLSQKYSQERWNHYGKYD